MPSNSWDRRPTEPEEAYAAFLIYRDMGEARTLARINREYTRPIPTLKGYSTKWGWVDRARAWDDHLSATRQDAVEKATRDDAEEWERRRTQQAREDYELARQFLKQARTLAAFPVTTQRVEKDGRTTIVEAIDPRRLRDAAAIAQVGRQMAWEAIREALPPDDDDFDPATATPDENRAYVETQTRRRPGRARRP